MDLEAVKELAPSGRLRAGIVVAPAPSALFATDEGGGPNGVAVDLFGAFGEEMKLPVDLVVFPNSGELTDAIMQGQCDAGFMPRDAEREKKVDFGPAYYMIESTFLVPAGSTVQTLEDANFPGARAIVISSTTTGRAAARFLTKGSTHEVDTVDEMVAIAKRGGADLFALTHDSFANLLPGLPGARVLAGGFQHTGIGCAVRKGKAGALKMFGDFVERAKTSGLVRRTLDAHGFSACEVAPPA